MGETKTDTENCHELSVPTEGHERYYRSRRGAAKGPQRWKKILHINNT